MYILLTKCQGLDWFECASVSYHDHHIYSLEPATSDRLLNLRQPNIYIYIYIDPITISYAVTIMSSSLIADH